MILALVALLPLAAFAGDGTKESPYTVSELNAQKDALAASGATVWVKADLKGLGEDGSLTENTNYDCAALFGDDSGTFIAYSYQIFGNLALSDLTNTKNLLIKTTYQKGSHPYLSDTAYESYGLQYASNYEPENDLHFSLEELHGALSLTITNGYRGYHIASSYILPEGVTACKTTASYTTANGASMTYPTKTSADNFISIKDLCAVLIAKEGTYDFVLTSAIYNQWNGGALIAGTKEGLNTKKDSYLFRFIATADKVGFERNSDNIGEVTLERKDEVYLTVSKDPAKFMGSWTFDDGETKKWIKWAGGSYEDYSTSDIHEMSIFQSDNDAVYNLQGQRIAEPQKGIYIKNGKKYVTKK